MHQIRFRLGLCPDPTGEADDASPDPIAGRSPTSKGREGTGRERRGRYRKKKGKDGKGEEGMRGKGRKG